MTASTDDSVATLSDLLDRLTGSVPDAPAPADAAPAEPAGGAGGSAEPARETAEPDNGATAEASPTVYADVAEFVSDYLTHVLERRVAAGSGAGVFWCASWWAHPEALSRVYALWRAWETLRVSDPATGMSVWWRDHLDPHLAQLTSEYGPFARCHPVSDGKPAKHHPAQPMPTTPIPAEVLAQFPEGQPSA